MARVFQTGAFSMRVIGSHFGVLYFTMISIVCQQWIARPDPMGLVGFVGVVVWVCDPMVWVCMWFVTQRCWIARSDPLVLLVLPWFRGQKRRTVGFAQSNLAILINSPWRLR